VTKELRSDDVDKCRRNVKRIVICMNYDDDDDMCEAMDWRR
jgi:hypothetical protein